MLCSGCQSFLQRPGTAVSPQPDPPSHPAQSHHTPLNKPTLRKKGKYKNSHNVIDGHAAEAQDSASISDARLCSRCQDSLQMPPIAASPQWVIEIALRKGRSSSFAQRTEIGVDCNLPAAQERPLPRRMRTNVGLSSRLLPLTGEGMDRGKVWNSVRAYVPRFCLISPSETGTCQQGIIWCKPNFKHTGYAT